MRPLKSFRSRSKRARPVGDTLERGTDDSRRRRRRNIVSKVGLFLALTMLTVAAFPRSDLYEYSVQVGEEWRLETLDAPFDFAIYKTAEEVAQERREVRYKVPPVFVRQQDAQARMAANRDTIRQQLDRIFEAYQSFQFNKSRGRLEQARADSLRYSTLRGTSRLKLAPEQWQRLVDDYAARVPGLARSTRAPVEGRRLDEQMLEDAWEFSMPFMNRGVLDVPRDSVLADQIIVRDLRMHTYEETAKDNVYGLDEVYETVEQHFQDEYEDNPELENIVSAFVRALFVPSLQYNRGATRLSWREEERKIPSTRGRVAKGEEIVAEGQRITDEIRQKLISLEREQEQRAGTRLLWRRALGQILLALSTFGIFFLYLFMVRRRIFDDNSQLLLMALLFACIIGLFALAVRIPAVTLYAVPVAIVSVLLTVVFDSRVGLFGTLTLALLGGLLLGYDFEFTFATLFGGTLGVFSVRDIKNRGQFFVSAGLVFVGYFVVLMATWLFLGRSLSLLGTDLLHAGISSFLLLLAYPMLWVFERTFDITTDLSLLELSDTNRPLLKELSLRAPGTFNHSLQVANLAEAAASAVEANALLTRVGALYHDIGKMLKPEYFVENQRPGYNPHDQLKPRMSALIIASHVKEGLEMGRQYRLPQRVLDFIPMHHGTTRIEYFYRKALDEHGEDDPPILEAEFRYPGPRPRSKETGILMLADSVEAASRSLSEPTHKRLESLIDMIVKARIEDGQLDATDLTFRDLAKIKETFLSLLLGIYHIRVKYPGQEQEEKRLPYETAVGAAPVATEAKGAEAVAEETEEELSEVGLVGSPEQSVEDPEEQSTVMGSSEESELVIRNGMAPSGQDSSDKNGASSEKEDLDFDLERRKKPSNMGGDGSSTTPSSTDISEEDHSA